MNIADIKTAVDEGQAVHWSNAGYVVRKDILGQYLIVFEPNGSAIGLTDKSGMDWKRTSSFLIAMSETS